MCRPKKMVCWEICFFKKTIACSCRWDILVSLLHWLAWRRTFFAIRELLCSWCLYSPCSVGPLLKPRKCVGLHVLWLVLCLSSFLFLLAQQCFLHHNSWSIVSVSVQCYCYVVYRSTKFCRFNIWTWYHAPTKTQCGHLSTHSRAVYAVGTHTRLKPASWIMVKTF